MQIISLGCLSSYILLLLAVVSSLAVIEICLAALFMHSSSGGFMQHTWMQFQIHFMYRVKR